MVFSIDSSRLVLAGHDRKIHVVDLKKFEMVHTFIPQRKEENISDTVREPPTTRMFTSSNGKWLADINFFGDIYVFNLEIYRQHWFISRLNDASVTAGGFLPKNNNNIVITTSANQVYVFDGEAKQLGKWSGQTCCLPRRFQEFSGEVIGLSFPPINSTSVIVYTARAMCFIDFGMPVGQDDYSKLPNGSNLSLEKYDSSKHAKTIQKRKIINQELEPSKQKKFDFFAFKDQVLLATFQMPLSL